MELTLKQFASLGGKARMKGLNKAQRRLLALKGVKGRLKKKQALKAKIKQLRKDYEIKPTKE